MGVIVPLRALGFSSAEIPPTAMNTSVDSQGLRYVAGLWELP